MTAASPTVERVLKGDLCTGCGLCASLAGEAIEMAVVAPGFSRPRVVGPVAPAAEARIAAACPGAVVEAWDTSANLHPYWGPWRQVATGHAVDARVRHAASSGGGITALALFALEAGLVDRVVHVLPDPEQPTRNIVVSSTDPADVLAGAGSRYASSGPLRDIERLLAEGGRFAFIGKPCDVSALRRLARADARVAEAVPLMLSFFCAGVPSHAGADRVIGAMGFRPDEVRSFRYRGAGWPGKARAVTFDGRSAEMSYARSWGDHLSKQLQFRCKICPDGVGGVADIACADAWYGDDDGYPKFEEHDGRSLIIARTEAGERVLAQAVAAGRLAVEPLEISEIDAMQPSQARRKRLIESRIAALKVTLNPSPDVTGTCVPEAARRTRAGEGLRSFAGTVRRILSGRR